MHELSIAHDLVEIASAAAEAAGADRVDVVRVQVGVLAGVAKDALLFSFELAAAGTPLAGARLEIVDVSVVIYCATCQTEQTLAGIRSLCCPVCQTPSADIRHGRELAIVALEVPDPAG